MATLPSKPVKQMTEEDVRAWKDRLIAEGKLPRPVAYGRARETQIKLYDSNGQLLRTFEADEGLTERLLEFLYEVGTARFESCLCETVRRLREHAESRYEYDPSLDKVIEHASDGKRYIVGVRNAELQRLQELKDDVKSGILQHLRPSTSR